MRSVRTFLEQEYIGDLTQSDGGSVTFAYRDEYLAEDDPTPLSLSMPLVPGPQRPKITRSYLLGLLPDRLDVRERWGHDLRVNGRNPFALLERMGLDCPGAVQFSAEDPGEWAARAGALTFLSDEAIAERLRTLRRDPTSWAASGERWSLAGAQAKFALARDAEGRWCEATGSAPSTHIVKPGISEYREQALNEHLCMAAGSALGLPMAATELVDFAGECALVIARYDRRRTTSGVVVRVHQEDLCQALGVEPARKYEGAGGPGAAAIADLLWSRSVGTAAVQTFADALILNYLLGAPDAHAKNYAVLLRGGQIRLAPFYDVASALPYELPEPPHDLDRVAMGIGGEKRFGHVTGHHWRRQARAMRLDPDRMTGRVLELAANLPDALATVGRDHHSELVPRLVDRVGAHCRRTVTALGR